MAPEFQPGKTPSETPGSFLNAQDSSTQNFIGTGPAILPSTQGSGLLESLRFNRGLVPLAPETQEFRSDLPMAKYCETIRSLLEMHRSVVVSAPTGSGKSTVIPAYLMQCGYNVIVTEPRILAARTLSEWVASQYGESLGRTVGYRTSMEGKSSRHTRLLYCTDGLQLVRELVGQRGKRDVLVIDEFHERNLNQDVLLAWARRQLKKDPDLKVLVTSATVDTERIARYLGQTRGAMERGRSFEAPDRPSREPTVNRRQSILDETQHGPHPHPFDDEVSWTESVIESPGHAPIVIGEGRIFDVHDRPSCGTIENDVEKLLTEGRNVLVFMPGKTEIEQFIGEMAAREAGKNSIILPLHRDLNYLEQKACFAPYSMPKCIVATNIAETSVTIPDIDAVVDSGLRRLVRTENGIEGLYTERISQAEMDQRKGRAGRTKEGIYIDASGVDRDDRPLYPQSELLRLSTKSAALRVKVFSGMDFSSLKFLDQPPEGRIKQAARDLITLGLFDQLREPTDLGTDAARLPVSVNLARMILHARHEGVVSQALKIAAIIETRGITDRKSNKWRALCADERGSDLIAQLKVFDGALSLHLSNKPEELAECGVNIKNFTRAVELWEQLKDRFPFDPEREATGDRKARIIRSFMAGYRDSGCIFIPHGHGWINGKGRVQRELSSTSVVSKDSEFIAGLPWDLSMSVGDHGRHLIKWASKISIHDVPMELQHLESELSRDREMPEGRRRGPRGRRGPH